MYGDNYFLQSSGLSRSLVSNVQPTSSSPAHVRASAHACANTFFAGVFIHFFCSKKRKLNSHVRCALLSPQMTECQRMQRFISNSLTFG